MKLITTLLFLSVWSSFCMEKKELWHAKVSTIKRSPMKLNKRIGKKKHIGSKRTYAETRMRLWAEESCGFCLTGLTEGKMGAIMQAYCGHTYHVTCCNQSIQHGHKKCYCGSDLFHYDELPPENTHRKLMDHVVDFVRIRMSGLNLHDFSHRIECMSLYFLEQRVGC